MEAMWTPERLSNLHDLKTFLGVPKECSLQRAFVDCSYVEEHPEQTGLQSNERVAFLGAKFLVFVLTNHLINTMPSITGGELERMLGPLITKTMLVNIGNVLSLDKILIVGSHVHERDAVHTPSRIANAVEALFGTMLIDCDIDLATHAFLQQYCLVSCSLDSLDSEVQTILQHKLKRNVDVPYQFTNEGTWSNPCFTATVTIWNTVVARGKGTDIEEARHEAAAAMMHKIEQLDKIDENAVRVYFNALG